MNVDLPLVINLTSEPENDSILVEQQNEDCVHHEVQDEEEQQSYMQLSQCDGPVCGPDRLTGRTRTDIALKYTLRNRTSQPTLDFLSTISEKQN